MREPPAGMTRVSLLLWIRPGTRSMEDAERSGRTQMPIWAAALKDGLFEVDSRSQKLKLTENGKGFLAEEVFSA